MTWLLEEPNLTASQAEWLRFERRLERLDPQDPGVRMAWRWVAFFWASEWDPRVTAFRQWLRQRQAAAESGASEEDARPCSSVMTDRMPKYMIDDPGPFAPHAEWVAFERSLGALEQDDPAVQSCYRMAAEFWANEWHPQMIGIRRRVRGKSRPGSS